MFRRCCLALLSGALLLAAGCEDISGSVGGKEVEVLMVGHGGTPATSFRDAIQVRLH